MRTALITAALLAAATAARADYTTTDLTPAGSDYAVATSIDGNNVAGLADVSGNLHAYSWTLPSTIGVDLHPSSAGPDDTTQANGISSTTQVGEIIIGGLNEHAALWTGTAASYTRLNETGFSTRSSVSALNAGIAVGYGQSDITSQNQALVWTNPTNPLTAPVGLPTSAGYNASTAGAINGNRVVGFATDTASGFNHAAMWDITNIASPVFTDIQPDGFNDSQALGTFGNQIVGNGATLANLHEHAILWTVSPIDSTVTHVDLNPTGYDQSFAGATNGTSQVGYAVKDGHEYAMLWSGTADSYVDLSQYLPAGLYTDSIAFSIDSAGDISGLAVDAADGNTHAFVWTPVSVPEPASALTLSLAALLPLLRRRK